MTLMRALTVLWLLFHAASQVWHVRADLAPPAGDDGEYLRQSYLYFNAFQQGGIPALTREFSSALNGIKAPLIPLLPLPLYLLFGPSQDAALLLNLALYYLLMGLVYRLGRRLSGESAGLLAVWITSTMPMLYGLSRQFYLEVPISFLVVLTLQLLIRASSLGSKLPWSFGLVMGLGLLAKTLYPVYVAGALGRFYFRQWSTGRAPCVADLGAWFVACLIAGSWYHFHWQAVFWFGFSVAFGESARMYGRPELPLARYWAEVVSEGLSWPHAYLLLSAVFLYLKAGPRQRGNSGGGELGMLLISLLGTGLFFSAILNRTVRYWMPAAPLLAVLIASVIVKAGCSAGARFLIVAPALLLSVGQFTYLTFGDRCVWAVALYQPSKWVRPPKGAPPWDLESVSEWLSRGMEGERIRILVHTLRADFNAFNLGAAAAKRQCSVQFLHMGPFSLEKARERMKDDRYPCLLALRGPPHSELSPFLRRSEVVDLPERIERGVEPPYHEIDRLQVSSGVYVGLYGAGRSCSAAQRRTEAF
ncbi:MAG: glycosyltransferase family 39 protein [Elusimicrobia bacterium]|nr:glycosyltransferase family 39 protein [Elusimicrobiota bacterium]